MSATDSDLVLALELADLADVITIERFGAADLAVETKPDMTPVSEADTVVEQIVRQRLAAVHPNDSIVGEEYGVSTAPDSARRWIIDPIDGTMSYVRGIPVWATLLALEVEDEVTVGVVSAPALGRRWWASRGGGAYLSDGTASAPRALGVSKVRELTDAQLCFGGLREWDEVNRADALLELGRECWRARGFGDFWGYMLVAEGSAEIALDPVAALWDLAATLLIVEEAGGRFTDLGGVRTPDGGDAVATNGLLHDAVLAIIGRS
jgi:histidinol-phosphatase